MRSQPMQELVLTNTQLLVYGLHTKSPQASIAGQVDQRCSKVAVLPVGSTHAFASVQTCPKFRAAVTLALPRCFGTRVDRHLSH